MAFGSRTVAQRDVNFNVNLGQFRAELGEAQATYARSTGAMSTEALKLSVAEERVARAIKAHGATSIQARNATVAYRREVQGLTTSTIISRDALLSEERALGRFTRGAIAGSGAARGLGRSLAFSSAAFLGSAGLIYALRASVKAAEAQEVALEQLKVALHNGGLSWEQYGSSIDAALNRQVKATAFTKEELTSTLAANVRRFGDVNQALRATAIEADVARAKNVSLADAFSLVQRASFGQPRSLRILGIELTKTTANTDALKAATKHASAEQIAAAKAADLQANETSALDAVQQKYHGNAAKYLTTTAGKQALFAAELKLTEEIIGQALLPELNHLLGGLTAYLEKLNRTGQLQRDARIAAHGLSEGIHGVADAFHVVAAVVSPVNDALGGVRHSVELLTLALIAFKLRGVTAFVTGARQVEVAAAAEAAAVSTAEAGAGVGVVGAIGAGLASVGGGAVSAVAGAVLASSGSAPNVPGLPQNRSDAAVVGTLAASGAYSQHLLTYAAYEAGISPSTPLGSALKNKAFVDYLYTYAVKHHLYAPSSGSPTRGPGGAHGGAGGTGGAPRTGGKGGTAPGGLILGLTNAQETALLLAQGTVKTGDDKLALDQQLAIYNRLLAQKGLNAQQRNDLLAGRNSVTSQLQQINDQNASAAKSAADKAAAARKKAAEEAARKRAALIRGLEQAPIGLRTAVETALANNAGENRLLTLYRKEREAIEHQIVELRKIGAGKEAILRARTSEAAIQKHINAITKKKPFDLAANEREFLSEFQNIQASYGTNVHVHQHFNAPPTTDGHREAIVARVAHLAAFDQ